MNIKVNKTECGLEFFNVYRIIGIDKEGDTHSIHLFASKERAEEQRAFCAETFKELYSSVYVNEEIVWCI